VPNVFDIFDASIDQRIREAWSFYLLSDLSLNAYLGGDDTASVSNRNGLLFASDTTEEHGNLSYPYGLVAVGITEVDPGVGTIWSTANLRTTFYQIVQHRTFIEGEKDVSALVAHVTRLFWENQYICTDLFLESPGLQERMTKRAVGIEPVDLTAVRAEGEGILLRLVLSSTWELEGDAWKAPPTPEVIP